MTDRRDVTGVWYGRYSGFLYGQDNSFIAVLEEQGGAFHGVVTELDDSGISDIRRASVRGQRDGAVVRFVKQYDGTSGWDHAVTYSGTIDAEGSRIDGRWLHDGWGASFTMAREQFSAEALEAEAEIELDEPVR